MRTQYGSATLEISLSVPLKTKHTLYIQPNNCIPGHLSHKKMKIMSTQKPIDLLIAALFIIASTWKQSKCPTTGVLEAKTNSS